MKTKIIVERIYNSSGNVEHHIIIMRMGRFLHLLLVLIAQNVTIGYRGYYYDNETGFYYLRNRYYDPLTGRFISPDEVDYLDSELIKN